MDFDKFLGKMQKLIIASEQLELFGGKKEFAITAARICVEYLKGQGYSVSPPHNNPIKIAKLDELIATFYGFIRNNYPRQMWSHPNEKKDRPIAKAFVERRMEADGIDRKTALDQCGFIVRTVLQHPDIFKFESAPSFGIFGQAKMAWITDRALQIINDQIAEDEAVATERAVDAMTERIEKNSENMGYSLEKLKAMNKRLEEQYGEKENKS
jgi:hypothetical protein